MSGTTALPIVTKLGARALRKLGVAIVPDASRPAAGPTLAASDIALRVLLERGIPVAELNRPSALPPVGLTELGQRTLRMVGVNPIGDVPAPTDVVTQTTIAQRALRSLGVNPVGASSATYNIIYDIIPASEIAMRALRAVGVNPNDPSGGSGDTNTIYSRATLAVTVLEKLAVIASDETPSSTDLQAAIDRLTSVHDMLADWDYIDWIADQVPSYASEFYVIMAANLLAPMFGKPANMDAFNAAAAMVKDLALTGVIAQTRALAKVQSVHEALQAESMVPWPLTAIPDSASEAYVALAAALLAPVHGKEPDVQAATAGKAHIRRIALSGVQGEMFAEDRVLAVNDELTAEGLSNWTLTAIPASVADAMTVMVEQDLAATYDREPNMQARETAKMQIRRIALSGPYGGVLAEAKVQAVHERLNAAGLVSWIVTAVPVAFAEDYVTMAAALVGPMYRTLSADEMQAWMALSDAAEGRIKRAGYVAMAQERALVRVQNVHDELNALGFVSWTTSTIPSSVAEAYTDVAAAQMAAADEGKPLDPAITAAAYQRVRMVAMAGPAGQALANQAVLDVHEDLDARGRIRWTIFQIPPAAEYSYVVKAAARMANDLGLKGDPNWDAQAERQLMQIVSLPSANRPVQTAYF